MHPNPKRLVGISVPETRAGSGYLINARQVLTAAHVVEGVERCSVLVVGDGVGRFRPATVVSRDAELDAALLELDEAPRGEFGPDPEWTAIDRADGECEAVGYPRFQVRARRRRVEHFVGELRPLTEHGHARLTAEHRAGGRPAADWSGMSGAALFARGYLVGIVIEAGPGRLVAARIAGLAERFGETLSPPPTTAQFQLWPEADEPALEMLEPWTPPRVNWALPSTQLRASYAVVPFDETGRDEQLAALTRLCAGTETHGMLVFTGEGGAGKTRLMVEWCRRLRRRGWIAGFVRSDVDVLDELRALAKGRSPRLVVVDYAGADPQRAQRVVEVMLKRRAGPQVMRVVLLARRAGAWVTRLRQIPWVAAQLDSQPPIELEPMYTDAAARERAYRDARVAFTVADDIETEPAEALDESGTPLLVQMQALLGRGETRVEGSVLDSVLAHEKRFWAERLQVELSHVSSTALDRANSVGAALVLSGGTANLGALAKLISKVCPDCEPDQRDALKSCFAAIYRVDRRITPLEPDRVGEELVAAVISRDADDLGEEGMWRWLDLPFEPGLDPARGLTVFTRLAEREPRRRWLTELLRKRGEELVAQIAESANARKVELPGPLLAEAVARVDDPDITERIGDAVPEYTVELREVEECAYAIVVARCRDGSDVERLARLLALWGRSLAALGKREEALEATLEAVDIRRELARERPDAFLPDLATSLWALGVVLNSCKRHEDAHQRLVEAARLLAPLANRYPQGLGRLARGILRELDHTCKASGLEVPQDLSQMLEQFGPGPDSDN